MFNMESIGIRISELRKEKNMTQMELADKMNISFQAVSNWERGNSMPDISKLPELAEILGVTIDELLGHKSDLIKNIIENKTEEYLENNSISPDEFLDIAPILKPEQADIIFTNANPPFDLSEIADLLPFISRHVIDLLAEKAAENEDTISLGVIAPFVSKRVIDDIAKKFIIEDKSIADIAPFVSRDMVGDLAEIIYERKGLSALDDLAPFIPKDVLHTIAEKEFEKHGLRYFESIAPFMNKEHLNELAKKAIQKVGIEAVSPIAPFVDKKVLTEYIIEKFLQVENHLKEQQ